VAPYGRWGCKNRACCSDFPAVGRKRRTKPRHSLFCLLGQFFVSLLCLGCIWSCFLVLVVSICAIDCLERLISEMKCVEYWSGTLNPTHSLTNAVCVKISGSSSWLRVIGIQQSEMKYYTALRLAD